MTRLQRRRRTLRYVGRHRQPRPDRRPVRPGRYAAAAGLLALSGHAGGSVALATAAPPATPARPAKPRHIARPAPVRAVTKARWVTETVPGAVYRGRATWYGPGFAGHRTASGERFDPSTDLTVAHRWLPFGTRLRVCRGTRCVVVRVNDRGPFGNAMLDMSYAAAARIGLIGPGIDDVTATVLTTRRVLRP